MMRNPIQLPKSTENNLGIKSIHNIFTSLTQMPMLFLCLSLVRKIYKIYDFFIFSFSLFTNICGNEAANFHIEAHDCEWNPFASPLCVLLPLHSFLLLDSKENEANTHRKKCIHFISWTEKKTE